MLRRLSREIWCILIQWLAPCTTIQRWLVRRKLAALREQREEAKAKAAKQKSAAQMHARLMAYPSYRCKYKIINFLRNTPRMWSFVDLAAAHYNTQIDHSRDHRPELYIKPDLDSKLDIAQDYFRRDRAGLVEWWCRFTEDGREFFDASDKIKLDLQIPFHQVLVDKCHRDFSIDVKPDSVDYRRHIYWPCIYADGSPNAELMEEVQAKAHVY